MPKRRVTKDVFTPEDSAPTVQKRRVRTRKPDPFHPAGDLDLDDTYPESTDRFGHSDNIQVRFPQGLRGAIWAVVDELGGRNGPFRNEHDFIRTAVFHLLHHWRIKLEASEDLEVPPEIVVALRAAEGERKVEHLRRISATIDNMDERYNYAVDVGSHHVVVDLGDEIYQFVQEVPGITEIQYDRLVALQQRVRDYARRNRMNANQFRSMPGLEEYLGIHGEGEMPIKRDN